MSKHWKLLKKLLSDYHNNEENDEDGGDSFVPILVHKNSFPVSVDEKFVNFFNSAYGHQTYAFDNAKYNYIIYIAKKKIKGFNFYWAKIVINNDDGAPPIVDDKLFLADEREDFFNYISLYNRVFKMVGKERDVLSFDGKRMDIEDFKEVVLKWIKKTER